MRLMMIQVTCLAASALVAALAMAHHSEGRFPESEYTMLLLVPYEVFFALTLLLFLIRPIRRYVAQSACATSLLMLIFTVFAYTGISSSSTGGLVFLFAPMWLGIGSPLVFLVGLLIAWLVSKQMHSNE